MFVRSLNVYSRREEENMGYRFAFGVVLSALIAVPPTLNAQQDKPRVYISGEGNVDVRTNASAVGGWNWAAGSSHSTIDKHDQTMELAKDFQAQCPGVTITLNQASADYSVALNHQAFNGLVHKNNQIMVANRVGDLVMSNRTRAVSHSVSDACAAILADFQKNGHLPATQPPPNSSSAQALSATPSPQAPATAAPQPPPAQPAPALVTVDQPQQSLGDIARKYREKKARDQKRQPQNPPN